MPGPRPRITSPGTPTPGPARKIPAAATTPPAPPASTTSPSPASSTTGKERSRLTTTPSPDPAAATVIRPPPGSRSGASGEQARRTTVDDFRQVIDLSQVTSDDTLLLARTAAEAIRGLNWLTGSEAGLGQPSAAYDVIGALALAASRLHQALAQITGWLDRALAAGRLGHDLGEDPAEAIDAAGIFLGDAGLSAARHTVIYLPNPMIGIRGLHEMIVATFGGQPDRSYSRLTAQAAAMLAAERDERGKTPVLVIDEAHLLRYEQLETIRMLTNHNLDSDSPLACLLIGQPTLRRTMKLAVLAALEQRTALRYAMPPMISQETSSYISHPLKLAGRSDPLVSDDAASLIHTTSRGYPRAVNNLAIQALVATYAAGKSIVDQQAARAAITEVTDT